MKTLLNVILLGVLVVAVPTTSHAAESKEPPKSQAGDKEKDKDKDKDPNKGGAGVGTPNVHGCDDKGCWNNGPSTPPDPPKKCKKQNGIEICL